MGLKELALSLKFKGFDAFNHIPLNEKWLKVKEKSFLFSCDDIASSTDLEKVEELAALIEGFGVKGTFFTVPKFQGKEFGKEKAKKLEKILKKHEIAVHGLRHERKEGKKNILEGKKELEKFFGEMKGYRSPYFHFYKGIEKDLKEAGFLYGSESFYWNKGPFVKNGLIVLPCENISDSLLHFGNAEKAVEFELKRLEEKSFYVFLFHIQNFEKGKEFLEKVLEKAEREGFEMRKTMKEFAQGLIE